MLVKGPVPSGICADINPIFIYSLLLRGLNIYTGISGIFHFRIILHWYLKPVLLYTHMVENMHDKLVKVFLVLAFCIHWVHSHLHLLIPIAHLTFATYCTCFSHNVILLPSPHHRVAGKSRHGTKEGGSEEPPSYQHYAETARNFTLRPAKILAMVS